MTRQRTKWRADRGTRAIKLIAELEASITALGDEDLLDLADIFKGQPSTVLWGIAFAEMARRNISL
jgi:hypothetical protein